MNEFKIFDTVKLKLMKRIFFSILFLLISIISYSQITYPQTLLFSKKHTYISYIDNNGQKQNKKMSTTEGNFKLVFGRATKTEWSPLLEIYGDSDQEGYFAFSKRYDNRQMGDKIYENNLFFSTQTNKGVVVLLAFDKSEIVLLYDDKVIQYSR